MLDTRETTWNKALYVHLYSGTDFSQGFFNMTGTQLQCTTPEETRLPQLQLKKIHIWVLCSTGNSSWARGRAFSRAHAGIHRAFGGHWHLGCDHRSAGLLLSRAACSPHRASGTAHTLSTQGCTASPWPYPAGRPASAFNAFKFN